MKSFADQLRAAPEEERERQKANAEAYHLEVIRAQQIEEERDRRIVNNVIESFQNECMKVAAKGKQRIDCMITAPYSAIRIGQPLLPPREPKYNIISMYSDYDLFTSDYKSKTYVTEELMHSASSKKKAMSLIPLIEDRLSELGLNSYRVTVMKDRKKVHHYYVAYWYYFICATW